jgi:hypothetical protein
VLIPGFFLFSIFRRQKVSPHSPWCTVSIGGRYAALGVGFRCGLVYCLYSVLISPFRRYPSNNFRYCSFTPHYGSARESSVNVLPVRGILGCLGSKSPVMPLFYPFGISSPIGRKRRVASCKSQPCFLLLPDACMRVNGRLFFRRFVIPGVKAVVRLPPLFGFQIAWVCFPLIFILIFGAICRILHLSFPLVRFPLRFSSEALQPPAYFLSAACLTAL